MGKDPGTVLPDRDDHKTTPGLYDTTGSNIACSGEREKEMGYERKERDKDCCCCFVTAS